MKKYIFIIIISLLTQKAVSQIISSIAKSNSSGWVSNAFENKVFIENKGQFNKLVHKNGEQILFGAEENSTYLLYSTKGLTYRISKTDFDKEKYEEWMKEEHQAPLHSENNKERNKEGQLKEKIFIQHVSSVNMEWINANPNVKILSSEMCTEYFNYGMGGKPEQDINFAKGYKKICYKGLYPGIDVEYTFHDSSTPLGLTSGTKYTLIVHPGADVSKVKMKYTGDGKVKMDKEGNIVITTPLGNIVDHTPITFYGESKKNIGSRFEVRNNIVSFHIDRYDDTKTIIIDPWTVNPAYAAPNRVFDIERDLAGNAFVFGAGSNYTLRKYNTTGTPIWTYNTGWPFPSFWYGDLAVSFNGSSFITNGSSNGFINRINNAGVLVYSNQNATAGIFNAEAFSLCFNVPRTKLLGAGAPEILNSFVGGSAGVFSIGLLNGAFTGMTPVFGAGTPGEIRGLTLSPNGNYYCLTVPQSQWATSSRLSRTIGFSPGPGFTNTWDVSSGYTSANFNYLGPAYTTAVYSTGYVPGGRSCIAASYCYVYTYNGITLIKRNASTGALINSITVAGGTADQNSGVLVDSCDNVYVGTGIDVKKYNSNLTLVSSAPTTGAVYDICFGLNQEILACGNGFVASLSGLVNICPAIPPIVLTAAGTNTSCGNNTGTAGVTTITNGTAPYTYLWNTGGTTSTITGLVAGTYTVTVIDNSCQKLSQTAVVTVTNTNGVTISTSQNNLLCNGVNSGSAVANIVTGTGPYTYSWSTLPVQTTSTATGLAAGTYTVVVWDPGGCSSTAIMQITQPTAILLFTSTDSTTCNYSNGSALVTASGGTPLAGSNYNYVWSPVGGTQFEAVNLPGQTYTVLVTDANGCTKTATADVAKSPGLSAAFTSSTACLGATVNFTNTGTAPGTGITYNWLISPIPPANVTGTTADFSYTFLTTGNYSIRHTVSNGTCMDTVTSNITIINCAGPTVTATGTSICEGSCATVTSNGSGGTGPYTYLWSNGATTSNISPCPSSTTSYTITITDSGGNTSTSMAVVTVNPAITASALPTNTTCSGGTNGSAQINPGSGTSPYTYNWNNGQTTQTITGLSAGSYSVTVTDAKGCTAVNIVTVISPPAITGLFTKGTANCNSCGCKEWIMVTATGGTSPYSYSWPDGYVNRYKNQLCPGSYNINIKDKNGCIINVNLISP
ncbi:MAG: SprB repeat-containing protein [Bacteroidetes bacterium]|nr:SprB repeat-containing protein [Bacteroidota bacterium]